MAAAQQPDEITLAVVAARLGDLIDRQEKDTRALQEAINTLRADLAASRADLVARGEWLQRNDAVNTRFQDMGREIGQLRMEHATDVKTLQAVIDANGAKSDARHAPWWDLAAVLAAIAAVCITLIPMIAR